MKKLSIYLSVILLILIIQCRPADEGFVLPEIYDKGVTELPVLIDNGEKGPDEYESSDPASAGRGWLAPRFFDVAVDEVFTVSVFLNCGNQSLSVFSASLDYNDQQLSVQAVLSAVPGFNIEHCTEAGKLEICGSNPGGLQPGDRLELLQLVLKAEKNGISHLDLDMLVLIDTANEPIGKIRRMGGVALVKIRRNVLAE